MDEKTFRELKRKLSGNYVVSNCLFWMGYVCTWGYSAVYLKDKGFSSTATGIVTALGGLISVILQPLLAAKIEEGERLTVRRAFIICLAIGSFLGIFLLLQPSVGVIAVLFVALMAVSQMNTAVINSLGMEYVNVGIPLNYGLARGAGGVCFGGLSLILGFVTAQFGADSLIILHVMTSVCLIGQLLTYTSVKKIREQYNLSDREGRETNAGEESGGKGGLQKLLKEDKGLCVLLLGFMFLFVGHEINNTYMIDLVGRFGGGEREVGIAFAYAAAYELPGMVLVNYLVKKTSSANILRISAVAYIAKGAILFGAVNMPILLLSQTFQLGTYAFFIPASVYYINERVPAQYKVTGQSVLGMATMGLGGAIGNFLGGRTQDLWGVTGMVAVCETSTVLGAVMIFAALANYEEKDSRKKED